MLSKSCVEKMAKSAHLKTLKNYSRVCFFRNVDRVDTLLEDRINVLILKPDFEVDANLQQMVNLNGSVFELHVIVTIKTQVNLNGMV